MLAELGMVLGDPGHRLADRAGHSCSSALGRGRGSSITTTQDDLRLSPRQRGDADVEPREFVLAKQIQPDAA